MAQMAHMAQWKETARRGKISRLLAGILAAAALHGCASSAPAKNDKTLTLEKAVSQGALAIAAKLPLGTRVAVVAFEAEDPGIADYVMDELTGALVDGSLEVADRDNLEYVINELDLRMSSLADDEDTMSIGKFLGAEYVITGQLIEAGKGYRYRVNAVNVETAAHEVSRRYTIRKTRDFQRLLADLKDTKREEETRVTKRGAHEKSSPKTAGNFLDRGILFADREDYDMAIADFTEAIKLDPNNGSAYSKRGLAYLEKQDYDRAVEDYSQALTLEPNFSAAKRNLETARNARRRGW